MLLLYAECDLMPSWENSGQAAHEYIKFLLLLVLLAHLTLTQNISLESTAPCGLYLDCI